MKITNKYITVEFMPGVRLYDAISEAQEFAIKNYAKVKYKFNGIEMVLEPMFPSEAWFNRDGKLKKDSKKDWNKLVEMMADKYWQKCDKLKAGEMKKLKKKDNGK